MSTMPDGTGIVRTTLPQLDFYLPDGTRPHPSVSANFYARFKTTYTFENKEYTFHILRNNGVRIWVGGQLVVDANVPNPGDPATWVEWSSDQIRDTWFDRKFTPAAGTHEIKVEFVDPSGYAHLHVYLLDLIDPLTSATWNAEYWDYSPFGWRTNMSAMADGSGKWRTSYDALDFYFASGVRPNAAVQDNFYARFKTSVYLENKPYVFRIMRDNGVRVWVNGQLAVGLNTPRVGDPETWTSSTDTYWFERPFIPSAAGEHQIVVEWVDSGSAAHLHLQLAESVSLDRGNCGWALSDESYFSPPTAWSDSPDRPYDPGSYCVLSLRGTIDLTGALHPRLEFYDRYNLQTGTYARVGVSEVGSSSWVDVDVHYNGTDLTWARQVYDLTSFGGRDFTDKIIELRFVLDATASTSAYEGWWLDNIKVEDPIERRYTVGFEDNMEGVSHWYPNGTWARSNEMAHSGSLAWSDSPGGDYLHGTNSTLELDGVIDLADPAVVKPEITFWHRYNLNYNDAIYVEVSADRLTWQALPSGTWLARSTTNASWEQVIIPLTSYTGQEIYFRFRLDARSDTRVADGWWVDDFAIRNEPTNYIYPNWCDGMEGGGNNWLPGGTWAVVNGLDYNPDQPQTIRAYAGSNFWSDSPGTNYAHPTNSALELLPRLNLTSSTNPELIFWHQWDLGYKDNLYVEVSTDGGKTWTQVWRYLYDTLPLEFCSSCSPVNSGYNHILSWHREVVSLRDYVGQIINIRFRLDALTSSTVDDGWWLDDICFMEHSHVVRTVGFSDRFEGGSANWYVGGTWSISPENARQGRAFSDSVGTFYRHESNAELELKGVINLAGTVKPTLYYWEAFNLAQGDYSLVEVNVSDDGGDTWQGWRDVPLVRHLYTTTLSWNRQQVDLRPFIPTAEHPNRVIRLRFRLYAVSDSRVAEGWWLDDVSLVDRNGIETLHPLSFNENVEFDNNYWVFEGTWSRIPYFRMVGSGTGLGPGGWTGTYYQDANANRIIDSGEYRGTRSGETEINYNWGSSRPSGVGLTSNNNFIVRWTRTIDIAREDTQFYIEARSDDGIRVIVDPPGNPDTDPNYPDGWAWNAQYWDNRGFSDPSNPTTGSVMLSQGLHTILVEYYENTGDARVQVDFGTQGRVFHDSFNSTTNYVHLSNMSTMLEGMINLAGTTNPALTYWDSRKLGSGDWVYTEVSTDEGFNWTSVWSANGTDATWTRRLIDLSAYAGQRINIRFRLDARVNTSVGDGWYIDDIVVAE
ncbi:MAG: PA14 domain-containing protein [Anaerolineae bacterium]|nr:PA14 domain-containing protein [Anaerolineae bacterium]